MASRQDSINELREARKKKTEGKNKTARQTTQSAVASRLSSVEELREQRAQQSKATSDRLKNTEKNRNNQTTQRKPTPSLADGKMIRDIALQRMKQAQMGLQKGSSTSVGRSATSNKPTTSHSSSSGTWAESSNPAYKQWAANNPAMAKAQEARSAVAKTAQETSRKEPAKKTTIVDDVTNLIARDTESIDYKIAEIKRQMDTIDKERRKAYNHEVADLRDGKWGNIDDAEKATAELDKRYNELQTKVDLLKRNKEKNAKALKQHTYNALAGLEDFEQFSAQGASIANPRAERVYAGEKTRHVSGIGAQYMQNSQNIDDVQNIVSFVRDDWDNLAPYIQDWIKATGYDKYLHMKDDEVKTYNYLLAKDGKAAADEYLSFIEETLNYRKGTDIGKEKMAEENDLWRGTKNTLYGLGVVGVDQWRSGTSQLLSSDRLPTSATQFAGQYIRENAGPVERFFFDAGTTTGNMLPSILISKGTGLIGSALGWGAKAVGTASTITGALSVGSGASGNAYNQALGEGYTKEEARKYATLVGASEAGLSAILGSNLVGGKINGVMKARILGIDNALGRIAVHWALSTGGEVTEEVLQEYLEPAFRSLIFDVDYDAPNFEEVAYVALLTALSAGAPGAVDAVTTETTNSRTGKSVKASEGGVKGLLDGALALDPSTESHKKATTLMNKKGEPNDAEIGDLKRTFAIDSIKADNDRIKAEVEKAKQFGEGSKASETATRIEEKLAKGKEVSDDDIAELLTDNAVAENEARSKQRAADADALVENAPAVEELVQQGRDLGGRASKEAERIASKVANGVEVTSNDIQRLMEVNENTKTAVDKYTKRVIDNAVARKITNYGEHGAQAFADAVNTSNGQDIRDVQLDFDTPYQAGLMNKNRNTMTFNTPLEKLAFNAGVQDYIAQRKVDNKHKAIVYTEGTSTFDWTNAPADITQEEKNLAEYIVKNLGVQGDFSSAEQAYNAFYDPNTGKTTFDAGFGISPELTKKIGNLDYLKKVEKLANERGQSFTFYLAHEIAIHRAMDIAPREMRAFVSAMYEYKQGKTIGANLAREKTTTYALRGKDLDTYTAMEEVVADVILDLYDGDTKTFADAIYRIGNSTNESAKNGMRTYFKWLGDFVEKLKAWAQKLTGRENATLKANVEQSISEIENLRNMFEKAIGTSMKTVAKARKKGRAVSVAPQTTLTETTSADGTVVMTDKSGNPVAMMQKDGSSQFSLKTYKESGRDALVEWLDKRVKEKKLTKDESADIIRQLDEFYEICGQFVDKYAPFGAWSNAEVVKGKNGKPAFSVVKANGDYAMNLDFSLVCKKRRTLDAVFGEMINRGIMDDVELGEADIVRINDIIRESGFETACALCFVDSKRYRQAMVTDNFVSKYNDMVEMLIPNGSDVSAHYFNYVGKAKDNLGKGLHSLPDAEVADGIKKLKKVMRDNGAKTVPHKIAKHLLAHPEDRKFVRRSDFMNTDGFEEVSINNPNVMKLYNSSKGSGGPKAAFSDVQYLGEILSKNNFTPERAYAVGGVRIQSFSDYIPRLVFDYLQMIGDLSAKKLPAHAYTKEALFAMQFGMTGIKVNMSLVPAVVDGGAAPGLDATGDYVWFDGQSFGSDVNVKGSGKTGFDLAVKIQNANGYSTNCGTIAVGISDEHIRKMLDDPNIRMIIPYHKSSLNHIVAMMNNIHEYENYTGVQNTRYAETGTKLDSKKHKDFNYNEALRRTGDAKAAANEYLAWCKKNNYIPKFDQFAWHDNYYKLLEDFSTYDNGVSAPQGPVTMTFPKEGDAFGSMAQLIEQGLEEDAVLEGRREKSLPKIVDEIEGALKKKPAVEESGSKKFSMKTPVEVSGDLVAMHNITADKLTAALDRGELIGPSTAITNKSFNEFGEISLIFGKDSIDPRLYDGNRMYGADAWTPQQTELKKNAVFDDAVTERVVADIKNRIGTDYAEELFPVSSRQFKDAIRNADGSVFDAYAHNIGMQTAYALEQGFVPKIPTTPDGKVNTKELQAILDKTLDKDREWGKYKNWLNSVSDAVISSYDTATNSDVLRNMEAQPATAKPFKLSENGELVVPAKEYKSVGEAKRNTHRLSESEKAAEQTKVVGRQFVSFANNIGKKTNTTTKDVVSAINNAFASRYSTDGIIKSFANDGITIDANRAKRLQDLYKRAVELPTPYFEAKLMRSVGFSEVATAVIPSNLPNALKQRLADAGVKAVEYKAGDRNSRTSAVQSVEGVKFSLKSIMDDPNVSEESKGVLKRLKDDTFFARYETSKYASYTPERIEREIGESVSRGNPDYAKSYITWMDPDDFIYATTSSESSRDALKSEAGTLDVEKLRSETQPIYLRVDFADGRVVGHEGRHRMLALQEAGVDRVAVIIKAENDDRQNTKPINTMRVDGQDFGDYRIGAGFYVHDALPLSNRYAGAVRELFADVKSPVKFSLKGDTTAQKNTTTESGVKNIEIDAQSELDFFGISDLDDFVGIQKNLRRRLFEDGFFDSGNNRKVVKNLGKGMVVEIGWRGIKETLGNEKRFEKLPLSLRKLKLATIRSLPHIIRHGEIFSDDQPHNHKPGSDVKYAYLECPVSIDGQDYFVKVDIRKSRQKNLFWIHRIYLNDQKGQTLVTNAGNPGSAITKDLSFGESLTEIEDSVKSKSSLKGEKETFDEIIRIREEGAKAGKSTSEIDQEVGAFVGQQYAELIKEYGAISRGEKASREIEVPKKSEEDRPVSQTVRTILEAEVTPDTIVPQLEEMVTTGEFSYDVFSDKSAMAGAKRTIKAKGFSDALADWYNAVDSGKVNKANTALGWELYNQAANAGDVASAINILNRIVGHQRDAAQALQATRILKKLTPDAQLYSAVKEAQKIEDDLMKKFPKFDGIKIDETLAEEFMQAETQEDRDRIMEEIYRDIGRQMPASWIDKFNAWRYMAMLTNPRTHIRNVIGNAAFAPLVIAKDATAGAIESTVNFVAKKTTGKSIGRTKGRVKSDLLKAAWEDFANVQDIVKGGGNKYNETANANRHIEEGRRIYKTKPLEAVRKTNSNLLDLEDMWFSKPHYAYALAQYCSANGITADQLRRGKALGNAREYAIREAQKATYRDTNAFSEMIGNLGRKRNANGAEKALGVVMSGILPFRKTPANILARGVGYSPVGLLKGLTYDLGMVAKGKKTAAEAIDSISAGLTGTGLIALGAFLAAQGLVRGAGGSDEEEKKFEELQGHQGYALELPDGTSVTLDWLAPEALPFFVGVNLHETTKEGKKGATASDLLAAITNISEPMLELSCLQSLNDVFDGVGYAKSNGTNPLMAFLASATTSYLTQYVPTIFGQAERSSQGKRMTTYTEKDNWLTSDMQYTLGKTSARIPGWDFGQIPYIDAWGRAESTGNPVANTANNFLNPAYTSKVETSAMERELARLYDRTGESKVLPQRADKSFTVDGERKDLTAKEYVKYATEKGKLSHELVTDLTKSKAYKKMDDADKAEAVSKAYKYADDVAKKKVDSDFDPQSWVTKAMTANKKLGMDETDYILYQTAMASADPEEKETVRKVDAIRSVGGLSDAEMAYLFDGKYQDGKAYRADEFGFDMEEYLLYRVALAKAAEELGTTTTSTKAKKEALKQFDFTATEKAYLKKEK